MKKILIFFLFLLPFNSFAYTLEQASSACNSAKTSSYPQCWYLTYQQAVNCGAPWSTYKGTNGFIYLTAASSAACQTGVAQQWSLSTNSCAVTGQTADAHGVCSCPSGQTVVNNACAYAQDCPAGQYKNSSGVCTAIPNCNANYPAGGYFFDVNSASCQFSTEINICIGSHPVNCPALHDCISTAQLCTNNAADLSDASSAQPSLNAAAKTAATSSSNQASQSAANAGSAATSKQSTATSSQQTAQTAQAAASQAAATCPTCASTVSAQQAAAQAAATAQNNATAAANAAAQAAAAASAAQIASQDNGFITPALPSGKSQMYADDAAAQATAAGTAAQGALLGSAVGSGSGSMNCPNCATEGTLDAVKTDIENGTTKGTNNGKLPGYTRPSWLDAPTIAQSTDTLVTALGTFPPVAAMNQLKNFTASSVSCPLGFDFSITIFTKTIPVQSNVVCDLLDSASPLMQTVSHVVYGLSAAFIFFSA